MKSGRLEDVAQSRWFGDTFCREGDATDGQPRIVRENETRRA